MSSWRSPSRDTPLQVKEAWDILYSLNPGLKQGDTAFPSDTARRLLDQLDYFTGAYTEHFLHFAQKEKAFARTTTPGPRQLRRKVGPLIQLKLRLDAAAAEKEVGAYDLEEMSLSLRANQQRVAAGQEEPESEEEEAITTDVQDSPFTPENSRYTQLSPGKRTSEHTESTLTKRLRSIAPLDTVQKPSFESVRPPLSRTGASTSTTLTSTTSIFTTATTVSSPTTSTDTPVAGALNDQGVDDGHWKPLPERSDDERYILITPCHRYHAVAFKHDIRYHTLMELQVGLDRHKLSYDDIEMDDFMSLAGPSSVGAAKIPEVLRNTYLSKGMVEEAEMLGRYNVDGILARARKQADDEEEVLAREEARTKKGKHKAGSTSEEQEMCAGKIVYSFALLYLGKKAKTTKSSDLGYHIQPSLASPTIPSDEAGPSTSRIGGKTIDEPENPFGQMAKACPPKSDRGRYPFIARCRPPHMTGKSFRLIRRYGSRRVIAFKLPKNASDKDFRHLFEGTVLFVFGRPFRALWATPDGEQVLAIETSGILPKRFLAVQRSPMISAFEEYLSRYNELSQKPGQAMAKWGSRPQIQFSDSIPVLRLTADQVAIIPDIVSVYATDPSNPATEEILTDGCGLMRRDVATHIFGILLQHGYNPRSPSTAIQIRFGGAKGMLALMSQQQELAHPGISLLLRPSMIKSISDPRFAGDVAVTTIDLVRSESLRVEVALTPEPMSILVDRGVPQSVLIKLQQNLLEEIKIAFSTTPIDGETEEQAEHRLRSNVYTLGGVGQDAKKRSCKSQGTSHRVAGLSWTDEVDEEGDESDVGSPYTPQGGTGLGGCMSRYDVDPISGQPNSIAESLYQVLCAGYHPTRSAYAADKLRSLVKTQCESIVHKFRLPVKQSLSAFIVPDDLGVLAPDELYICASDRPPIDPLTQTPTPTLLGPVLALRSPCKLPTDIRKMNAVYKPELTHLRNVIVMSANSSLCRQSPASLCSGGDYDGDTVQLFWDPDLVRAFTNADESLAANPPGFIEENFVKEVVKGREVLEAMDRMSEEGRIRNLQRFLLGGLGGDGLTGKYSDWHGNAQYRLGVSHPETIRLGRMFCHVLDARKSGLRVKEEVLKQDAQRYSGDMEWRCVKKGMDFSRQGSFEVKRPGRLGRYIMDELHRVGKSRIAGVLASFPDYDQTRSIQSMDDYNALSATSIAVATEVERAKAEYDTLCAHLRQANVITALPSLDRLYPAKRIDFKLIERHVEACYEIWYQLLFCSGTSEDTIKQQYAKLLADVQVPYTPKGTPHLGSPTKSREERGGEFKLRRANTRELALIWRDQLQVGHLQALCPPGIAGEEWLREMKVSIGSSMERMPNRQKFVFDMDFRTACSLRAKNSGKGSVTMLERAWSESRPTRQAMA